MIVRPAEPRDAGALAAIYGWHVLNGTGTFEETPPSLAEIEARRAAVVAHGLPYLAAVDGEKVLGFAYAAPFRSLLSTTHALWPPKPKLFFMATSTRRSRGRLGV